MVIEGRMCDAVIFQRAAQYAHIERGIVGDQYGLLEIAAQSFPNIRKFRLAHDIAGLMPWIEILMALNRNSGGRMRREIFLTISPFCTTTKPIEQGLDRCSFAVSKSIATKSMKYLRVGQVSNLSGQI